MTKRISIIGAGISGLSAGIFARIIIPVTWFASSVYVTRLAVKNVHIEFALVALVLVIYAVVVDFPQNKKQKNEKV